MNAQLPEFIIRRLRKIERQIIEKFGTRSEFFFHVGYSVANGSRVLNGFTFLTGKERMAWANALDLPESIFPDPIYRSRGRSKHIVGWNYRMEESLSNLKDREIFNENFFD